MRSAKLSKRDNRPDPRTLILDALDDPDSGMRDLFFVVRLSHKPVVEYISQGMADILPISTEQIYESFDAILGLVHPDDIDVVTQALQSLENRSGITYRFRTADDTWRWIEHRFITRTDVGPDPMVIGVGRDVTEQVRERDEARQERDFFQHLFDTVNAIVILMDDTGFVIRVNKAFEEVTGYRSDEAVGKQVWAFASSPDRREFIRSSFQSVREGMFQPVFEAETVTKSGETRYIEWRSALIRAPEGRLEFVISTGIDITERVEAERGLKQALEDAHERTKEITGLYRVLALTGESPSIEDVVRHAADPIRMAFQRPEKTSVEVQVDGFVGRSDGFNKGNTCLTADIVAHGSHRGRLLVCVGDSPEPDSAAFLPEERVLVGQIASVIGRDLEQRMDHEETQSKAAALEATAEMVVITNRDGVIEYVNRSFEAHTGYSRDEVIGQSPRILKSGAQDPQFYRELWRTILDGETWSGEMVNRRKDGSEYHEEMTVNPVRSLSGEITHFVAIKRDVSDRKAMEAELTRLAMTDPLTGLANRRQFEILLAQAIREAVRRKTTGAVAFVDLDNFKAVNDRFGHQAGDQVLRSVGERLRSALRRSDVVARFGGDEFALLLHDTTAEAAVAKLNAIVAACHEEPFEVEGVCVTINCSAGLARYPVDDCDPERLMEVADVALYRAKRSGGGRAVIGDAVGPPQGESG